MTQQPTSTRAAVVSTPGGLFTLQDIQVDAPRADEVLIRMVATGICHTDLTIRSFLPAEMFPSVFGHEGAGVVEAVGSEVKDIEVGDHVVLSYRSCRTCAACKDGRVAYCENTLMLNYMGMRLDGSTSLSADGSPVFGNFFGQSSLAGYALAYADNCVVVDRSLDLARIAPFGCGFQTGAGTVLNLIQPGPETALAVFGVGAVGLAALAAAQTSGAGTLIAVDPKPERRELAARYGAIGIDPINEDPVARIKELTGGAGATHAIDTTAISDVVLNAQRSLRTQGELIALGLGASEYTLDAIDLLQSGKTVRSSLEGDADPQVMVPLLLELAAAGKFDVDHLIQTYSVDQLDEAFEAAQTGSVVKPVILW